MARKIDGQPFERYRARRGVPWHAAIAALTVSYWLGTASCLAAAPAADAEPSPTADAAQITPVTSDVYMVTADGINVAVQTGADGAVVVNAGPAGASKAILAAIAKVTNQRIRFVVDTSADAELVGGNAALASAGQNLGQMDPFAILDARLGTQSGGVSLTGGGSDATIVARQSVLTSMVSQSDANYSSAALPGDTYTRPQYSFYINEPIAVSWQPAAHSDGDSVVRFERSDVVVTGEVFDQTRFPVIDLPHGGSIQGEIDALNQLINILVFDHIPVLLDKGGTQVIPVRGPVSDQADLCVYRDMVATIRDRIQYYIDQGKGLKQIQAADPAQGYRVRYGSDTGSWTTDDFVAAVYKSLMNERKAHHGEHAT